MRLWHYELIPYLPKSQLITQWRELNSIFKNQPKHILINYVYDHPKRYLIDYSFCVIKELRQRGIHISNESYTNMLNYCGYMLNLTGIQTYPEHNDRYLRQCFYNLQEKHDRGQKDFTKEAYETLYKKI